jgi:hypothetical protein
MNNISAYHVVDNHIKHEIHATIVQRLRERLEVIRGPEVLIDGCNVRRPVAVERLAISALALEIGAHGRNPNGIKTHVLNVVEVVLDTLEGAATVNTILGVTLGTRIVRGPKAVRNDLCVVTVDDVLFQKKKNNKGRYAVDERTW